MEKTINDLLLMLQSEDPRLADICRSLFERASISLHLSIADFRFEDFSRIAELAVKELEEADRRRFYEALIRNLKAFGSRLPEQLELSLIHI